MGHILDKVLHWYNTCYVFFRRTNYSEIRGKKNQNKTRERHRVFKAGKSLWMQVYFISVLKPNSCSYNESFRIYIHIYIFIWVYIYIWIHINIHMSLYPQRCKHTHITRPRFLWFSDVNLTLSTHLQTDFKQENLLEIIHDDKKLSLLLERLSRGANGLAIRSMSSWC